MALITCPICGNQISDKAPACLHCGHRIDNIENIPQNAKPVRVKIKKANEPSQKAAISGSTEEDSQNAAVSENLSSREETFEKTDNQNKSKEKLIIGILALLVLGLIGYIISTHQPNSNTSSIPTEVISETVSSSDESSDSSSNGDVFQVNKQIFDDQYLTLTCNYIDSEGVVFTVKSKLSNRNIDFDMDTVALDGQTIAGAYGEFVELSPGAEDSVRFHANIQDVEHKTMSLHAIAFNDQNTGFDTVDICDFDIGGTEHKAFDITSKPLLFKGTNFELRFFGIDDAGILLAATNYDTKTINTSGSITRINEKEFDQSSDGRSMPPHSTIIITRRVFSDDPDLTPNEIKSFSYEGDTYKGTIIDEFNVTHTVE